MIEFLDNIKLNGNIIDGKDILVFYYNINKNNTVILRAKSGHSIEDFIFFGNSSMFFSKIKIYLKN